jgi:hypothetical protein
VHPHLKGLISVLAQPHGAAAVVTMCSAMVPPDSATQLLSAGLLLQQAAQGAPHPSQQQADDRRGTCSLSSTQSLHFTSSNCTKHQLLQLPSQIRCRISSQASSWCSY